MSRLGPGDGVDVREAEPKKLRAQAPPAVGLRRRVPAAAEEVAGLRRAVVAFAEAQGASRAAQADIAVAVSEACTNVVAHAYLDAAEPGSLTVESFRENRELVVIVTDEGSGIIPRTASPGLGLGLPLIAGLTERLEVDHHAPSGTKLQMTFAVGVET